MITNSFTEVSARKWAETNTPEHVNYTVLQLTVFLSECSTNDGAIWLHKGWQKMWGRVQENLSDEWSPVVLTKP